MSVDDIKEALVRPYLDEIFHHNPEDLQQFAKIVHRALNAKKHPYKPQTWHGELIKKSKHLKVIGELKVTQGEQTFNVPITVFEEDDIKTQQETLERVEGLAGMCAPQKIEHSGADGGPIIVSHEITERIRKNVEED